MGFIGKTQGSNAGHTTPFSLAESLPVQTKLEVSKSADASEREATTVARKVVDDQKTQKVARKEEKRSEEKKIARKEEKKTEEKKITPDKTKKASKKDDGNETKPVEKEREWNFKPWRIDRKEDKKEKPKPAAPPIVQKPAEKKASKKGDDKTSEHDEAALKAIEQKIQSRKGAGMPLPAQVKAKMEQSFQEDFSNVRIHIDREAAELCNALHAQAFAFGSNIFFNIGRFDPGSDEGLELLAHELTHVVQQKDVVQRDTKKKPADKSKPEKVEAEINGDLVKITAPSISLPKAKKRHSKLFKNAKTVKGYNRAKATEGTQAQAELWRTSVKEGVQSKLNDMIPKDDEIVYFQRDDMKLFGTKKTILDNCLIPLWNKDGKASAYDADHMLELQLGGENKLDNLELLNFSANRGSGSAIKNAIEKMIDDFIRDNKDKLTGKKTFEAVTAAYQFQFDKMEFDKETATTSKAADWWAAKDIKEGEHLKGFKKMSKNDVKALQEGPFRVFTSPIGGRELMSFSEKKPTADIPGFKGVVIEKKTGNSELAGTLKGTLNPDVSKGKIIKPMTLNVPIYHIEGLPNAGYIDRKRQGEQGLTSILKNLNVEGLSPVVIDAVDIVPGTGFVVTGRIQTSIEAFKDLYVDFLLEGNKIEISRTFSSGDVKSIPAPFKVNDCSVTIFAGTAGIGVGGSIDFAIDRVGKGSIKGLGKSDGLFKLNGNFDFDEKLFGGVKAGVSANYEHVEGGKDKWDVNGTIHIPEDKIKGIKKADIIVSYKDRVFKADGNATFSIPGLEEGKLSVIYSEDQLTIEGEASFKHKLIKEGNVKARIEKVGDTTGIMLAGTAKPAIPGVDSSLSVTYNNGVLTIIGSASYSKGRLSGSLEAGITNQTVGADGKPSPTPSKTLHAFGGGTLSLKINDWLRGTAGVKLLEDGSVEVLGKIGIAESVDIFPRKEIKKSLFKAPTIEIPIFAIPLGSRSIGLVATIGGGLDAEAGIGPGQLTKAEVEVKYNPAHEETTSVTGTAKFRVPADAGIRVYVRAGIGASIGIARVAGGLEIGGALGIQGAAEAEVQVNWTPTQGFKLDAEAALSVQPKFKFDVNAYIEAVLDLWITEISKEWKWNLLAFEWGPSMKFGLRFPVHYEENKPFDIKLDDVVFEKPDISVSDIAKGIGQKIIG